MKIFATLPAEARRALARRELVRRGIASDVDLANEREGEAISALMDALRALLPDVPAVMIDAGDHRRVAMNQPATLRDLRAALAARIAAETTSTEDLAVLLALPADALATLGMSPEGFVTWLQSIDDRF